MDTVFADLIPHDGRVLTVDMEDLGCPLTQLRNRIDEADHLVAGLPLKAKIVGRDGVEHHLPGAGIMGDVEIAGFPRSAHVTVLESQSNPFVGRPFGQLAEDVFEAGNGLIDWLAAKPAGEAGDQIRAEEVGIVDEPFPACERLKVDVLGFEWVAEDVKRADDGSGAVEGALQFISQPFKIHVPDRLPEHDLKALESVRQDLTYVVGGGRISFDHCTDPDVLVINHAHVGGFLLCCWRGGRCGLKWR